MPITYPNFASLNALQKHVAFFDKNEDGVLTVSETAQGLRELGQGTVASYASAAVIHLGLASAVNGSIFKLDMKVKDIAKGKHDSDTDIYTPTGEVDMARFNALFERFDTDKSGALTGAEIAEMRAAVKQKSGGFAAQAEWSVLLSLLGDVKERGGLFGWFDVAAISKPRLAAFYSGTLMFDVAAERAK